METGGAAHPSPALGAATDRRGISGNSKTCQHTDEEDTVTAVLKKVSSNMLSYDASSGQGGMIHVTGRLTRQWYNAIARC
jgi:hypothetical protein